MTTLDSRTHVHSGILSWFNGDSDPIQEITNARTPEGD